MCSLIECLADDVKEAFVERVLRMGADVEEILKGRVDIAVDITVLPVNVGSP